MKRKTKHYSSVLLMSALLVMGVTACGSSKSAGTRSNMAAPAAAYDMVVQETAAAYQSETYEAGADYGLSDSTSTTQVLPTGRKLIRNMDLTVETNTFDQFLDALTSQVGDSGGYVEQSNVSGNSLNYQNEPIPRYASITARIPSDKLDAFINTVENSGNVTNKSESTQDVTLQYSDLESRKKSLTVEQDRLWALLEKADTLEAVIALESRLSEIRYQLESMESQLRTYDNQVDYSTVYLYINEIRGSATFTPTEPESLSQRIQNGFTRNIKAVSQGLTTFFIGLITTSPFWIPVVLLLLIILTIGRRRKKKLVQHFISQDSQPAEDSDTRVAPDASGTPGIPDEPFK